MAVSEPKRNQAEQSERSKRWLALDVFRGLAVLSMIQGHTFTVLLQPKAYGATWLPWYTLLHGLTAPMFLVGGGLAYGIVRLRPSQDEFSKVSPRILRRAVELLVVGYLLQLPRAPLSELFERAELLQGFLKVGPLQLVASCLVLLELLRSLSRTRGSFLLALGASTLTICLAAPFAWKLRASTGALMPVGTWLDGYAGSLFPFFPWSVFFFVGVLCAAWAGHGAGAHRAAQRSVQLGALSLLGSVAAYAAFLEGKLLRSLYGEHELWHTSPLYVVFRGGLVLSCLALLWFSEPLWRAAWKRSRWIEPVFGTLSRQSLVAYVAHLLILYGTPWTTGLVKLGTSLNLLEASLTFGFVLLLTTALVVLWDHFVTAGTWRHTLRSVLGLRAREQVDRIGEGEGRHARASHEHIEPRSALDQGV